MSVEDECRGMRARANDKFSYNFAELFVFPEQHLIYCPVYKAGTSDWFRALVLMSRLPKVMTG